MPPFVTIISDAKPFVNIFFTCLLILFYFALFKDLQHIKTASDLN